jgi:hypothetical protein
MPGRIGDQRTERKSRSEAIQLGWSLPAKLPKNHPMIHGDLLLRLRNTALLCYGNLCANMRRETALPFHPPDNVQPVLCLNNNSAAGCSPGPEDHLATSR